MLMPHEYDLTEANISKYIALIAPEFQLGVRYVWNNLTYPRC